MAQHGERHSTMSVEGTSSGGQPTVVGPWEARRCKQGSAHVHAQRAAGARRAEQGDDAAHMKISFLIQKQKDGSRKMWGGARTSTGTVRGPATKRRYFTSCHLLSAGQFSMPPAGARAGRKARS